MEIIIPYQIVSLVKAKLESDLAHFWPVNATESVAVPVLLTDSVENIPMNEPLAVILMSGGLSVDEQTRRHVAIEETIVVIIAARDASSQLTGEGAMGEAGPLIKQVFSSLFQWEPNFGYSRLEMIDTIGSQHEAGYGYYPIAFVTRYVLTGVN